MKNKRKIIENIKMGKIAHDWTLEDWRKGTMDGWVQIWGFRKETKGVSHKNKNSERMSENC